MNLKNTLKIIGAWILVSFGVIQILNLFRVYYTSLLIPASDFNLKILWMISTYIIIYGWVGYILIKTGFKLLNGGSK